MARKTTKRSTKSTTAKTPAASAPPVAETTDAPAQNNNAIVMPSPDVVETLTKKDLIDRVVEASGEKKKHVKPAVEATLRALGEALSRGDTLNLQPMGKGIVKTRKALDNAEVIELRLRRSKQSIEALAKEALDETNDGDDSPLAEAAE